MAQIASLELEHPLMNAAGTCKSVDEVERLARSAVAAVVVGSITCERRSGNDGTTYWAAPAYALNSLGLPNEGVDYYRDHLPRMSEVCHAGGKPLIVSLAGFTVDEYVELASAATHADLLELNLACPNVWDGGEQKRIACFDVDQTERVCRAVQRTVDEAGRRNGRHPTFGVKVSPFSDPAALSTLAQRLADISPALPSLRCVTAVNTFPNGYALADEGRGAIGVGLAGVSGPALKPIGLGQVRQLRRILPDAIDVIGVGGITGGRDVHDYLAVGAAAVQVATAYWNRQQDPNVFGEMLSEYLDVLAADAVDAAAPR